MDTKKSGEKQIPKIKHALSPIKSLFEASYQLCKQSLLSLFIISILSIVCVFGIILILSIIVFVSLLLLHNFSALIPLLIGAVIIFAVSSVIVSLLAQAASVLVIDTSGEIEVITAIKKSYPLLFPLFIVEFLIGLLSIGGYFLFILPGILFAIFFVFAPFEVVLGNHRGITAIKNSYSMVKTHFGEIFMRMLLIFVIQTIIQFLPRFIPQDQFILHMIVQVISFICNLLFGWFALIYYVLLYKQVKEATVITETKHMAWVYIVSLIGWVLGVVIVISMIALFVTLAQSGQLQKLMKQYHMTSPYQSAPSPAWQLPKHATMKNAV